MEQSATYEGKPLQGKPGVFAVLPAPCDDWGLVGAGVEGSPDKWGSLHNGMTSQFVVVSWPQRGTGQG